MSKVMGSFFTIHSRKMKKTFDASAFKEKLEASGSFPMLYMFKFIVPTGKETEVAEIFPKHELKFKESSGKKYISVTIQMMSESSDQILDFYLKVAEIEGVISL